MYSVDQFLTFSAAMKDEQVDANIVEEIKNTSQEIYADVDSQKGMIETNSQDSDFTEEGNSNFKYELSSLPENNSSLAKSILQHKSSLAHILSGIN